MTKKRKSLAPKTSAALLAALLAVSLSACGTGSTPDTNVRQETSDGANAETSDQAQTEPTENDTDSVQSESPADNAENGASNSDNGVTNELSGPDTKAPSKVTVTFRKTLDETKADDGTVIHTSSVQMPVVSIEDATDIADKINADIAAYFDTFSADDTISMAKEDYAASLGEDGWDFIISYSTDISTKVTRMDDAVISFEITFSDYTGGAHGNYGTVGRNYNVKTGDLIAFDELAEDYAAFHATVLDYMINLAETPAYKGKLFGPPSKSDMDSTLFTPESWVFTRSGISFLADPYVLGPFSSGTIYFRLPYEKAYDLGLKEDYRYNGIFVDERYYIDTYDPQTGEQVVDGEPDCYFDLDGDGTEEGLAFYGQVVDPATGESRYAFYVDGVDYGAVINDELQNIKDNGYLETSYALYRGDATNAGITAIAILFTESGEGEDANGNPIRYPRSFIFTYTKEQGLDYFYWVEGYVTLPMQP